MSVKPSVNSYSNSQHQSRLKPPVYRQLNTLPKPLYESMPYLCMTLGLGIMAVLGSWLSSLSGVCFFLAGSIMWILRSNNRRKDTIYKRRDEHDSRPEWYELKPFFWVIAGILGATRVDGIVPDLLGAIITLSGGYLLIKRVVHRSV